MCRGKAEGGRRCPCSSPERQRAYRSGRKLRQLGLKLNPDNNSRVKLGEIVAKDFSKAEIEQCIDLSISPVDKVSATGDVSAIDKQLDALQNAGFNTNTEAIVKLGATIDAYATLHAKIDIEQMQEKTGIAIDTLQIAAIKYHQEPSETNLDNMKALEIALEKQLAENRVALDKISACLQSEISAYTPLGGQLDLTGSKNAVSSFATVAQCYPTCWIEASNKHVANSGTRLRAVVARKRAHYQIKKGITKTSYEALSYTGPLWQGRAIYASYLEQAGGNIKLANEEFLRHNNAHWYESVTPATTDGYNEDGSINTDNLIFTSYDKCEKEKPKRDSRTWHEYQVGDDTYYRRVKRVAHSNREVVNELTTSDDGLSDYLPNHRTSIHELAHRMEHVVAGLPNEEQKFLYARAKGESVTPIFGRSKKELGYKDSFINHYMGKTYNSGHTEIMSMGMESVFAHSYGGFLGLPTSKKQVMELYDKGAKKMRTDLEYRHFVIGMLTRAKTVSNLKK